MIDPIRFAGAFFHLPSKVKHRVCKYFVKRLVGRKATTHETIWTSFLYFSAARYVRISEIDEGQFEVIWEEDSRKQRTILRDAPSSDVFVFFQVFIANGYRPLFDFLKQNKVEINNVVDAGTNVGYFAQAVRMTFRPHNLLGLEPERSNFLQASKNVEPEQATLLQVALWTHNTTVSLRVDHGNDWGVRISDDSNANDTAEAVSMSEVFRRMKVDTIDLLKMDIEGAEFDLFQDELFLRELKRVKCLAIEIHDTVGDRNSILKRLHESQYKFFDAGELTVAWNTNFFHV